MPYAWRYGISIVVTTLSVMGGVTITAANALGLTEQHVALLGILLAGLGVIAGVLPPLQKYPSPERKGLD